MFSNFLEALDVLDKDWLGLDWKFIVRSPFSLLKRTARVRVEAKPHRAQFLYHPIEGGVRSLIQALWVYPISGWKDRLTARGLEIWAARLFIPLAGMKTWWPLNCWWHRVQCNLLLKFPHGHQIKELLLRMWMLKQWKALKIWWSFWTFLKKAHSSFKVYHWLCAWTFHP